MVVRAVRPTVSFVEGAAGDRGCIGGTPLGTEPDKILPTEEALCGDGVGERGKGVRIIRVNRKRQDLLAGVTAANGRLGTVLCAGESGKKEGRKDGDNGDDDEQFNQRERSSWRRLFRHRYLHVSGCGWLSLFQRRRASSVA